MFICHSSLVGQESDTHFVACGEAVEKLYISTGKKDLWVQAGRDWLNEVAVSGERKVEHISDCDIPGFKDSVNFLGVQVP